MRAIRAPLQHLSFVIMQQVDFQAAMSPPGLNIASTEALLLSSDNAVDLGNIERNKQRRKLMNKDFPRGAASKDDENVTIIDNDCQDNIMMGANEKKLASTIQSLETKVQELLRVASCLDSLDQRLLWAASSFKQDDITHCLDAAVSKGILSKTQQSFAFATTNTRDTMYRLIPSNDRQRLHLDIHRNLLRNLTHDGLENHYALVLKQFRLANRNVSSPKEQTTIAVLCLKAGEQAVSTGDFESACTHLDFGIHALFLLANDNNDAWKDNKYDLTLALFNASAEVLYCAGAYEDMNARISAVIDNARCFRDTLVVVRATRVYALGSQYKTEQALDEGLHVLDRLGETFPRNPRKYRVAIEFIKTKRMLQNKSNEYILRLPLLQDADKLAAVQILNVMYTNAYDLSVNLSIILILRLIQLTMEYGTSGVSSVCFALYAAIVSRNNKEEGYRYSQLALALLDKFQAREWKPRVYVAVYGEASTYHMRVRDVYPHLKVAHLVGLETGDIEVSFCEYMTTHPSL